MELPANLNNGLEFTLAKNLLNTAVITIPYLALTPNRRWLNSLSRNKRRKGLRRADNRDLFVLCYTA